MTMMESLYPIDGLGQIGENATENVQRDFVNSRFQGKLGFNNKIASDVFLFRQLFMVLHHSGEDLFVLVLFTFLLCF